jgi:hypothetical protein
MANDYEKDAKALSDISQFITKHRPGANLYSMLQNLSNNVIGNPGAGKTVDGNAFRNYNSNARVDDQEYVHRQTKRHRMSAVDKEQGFGFIKDPLAYSQISYPSDITTNIENGHYMLFYVNVQNKTKYHFRDYEGNNVGGVTTVFKEGSTTRAGSNVLADSYSTTASDASFKLNLIKNGGIGNINESDVHILNKSQQKPGQGSLGSWAPSTTRITDSIALYLPANVSSDYSAKYSTAEMGVIGFAAASGVDFMSKFNEDDFEGAAKALKGSIGSVGQEIVQRALAGIADLSTGGEADTYGLANKIFGRATNPYMEVIFEQAELRKFTYNFTFQPKDQKERDDVQDIIKTFRFHMAPELQSQNMRFMGIPATFDIHYMYQPAEANVPHYWRTATENQYFHKISTCVLENCSVDYTSDGVRTFRDGSPTVITMRLEFQETEMITKEMIDKGY